MLFKLLLNDVFKNKNRNMSLIKTVRTTCFLLLHNRYVVIREFSERHKTRKKMRIDHLECLDNLDKKLCRNRLRDNVIPESSEV